MPMIEVNVWELMTTIRSFRKKDRGDDNFQLQDERDCEAFQTLRIPHFGTEYILGIDTQTGVITFKAFYHSDCNDQVDVAIFPDGIVRVSRQMDRPGDLTDRRNVTF
jgi:hypothetical protein